MVHLPAISIFAFLRRRPNAALWLLAFTLFLKAVLPAGTMLAPTRDGFVRIVVCTAQGLVMRTLDTQGKTVADQHLADTQGTANTQGTAKAPPDIHTPEDKNPEDKNPEQKNHASLCVFQVLGFAVLACFLLLFNRWPTPARFVVHAPRTTRIKIWAVLLPPSRAPPLGACA